MTIGNPNPRSLANLRPPFAKGNQIRKGQMNQWVSRANELREDLWKAANPEYRAAMAKMLCELSLGRGEEPVFDDDGVPIMCPDGTLKMRPLPPARRADMQKWATDTILNCLGGSFSFKSIEASLSVEDSDVRDRAVRIAQVMVEEGLGDRLPPAMRALVEQPKADP